MMGAPRTCPSRLFTGVVVFMGGENAGFTESFYWAVVTASTIGYGDVVPTTSPMRWFTTFFSIVATVSMLETLRVAGAYPFRIWKLQAEAKVSNLWCFGLCWWWVDLGPRGIRASPRHPPPVFGNWRQGKPRKYMDWDVLGWVCL